MFQLNSYPFIILPVLIILIIFLTGLIIIQKKRVNFLITGERENEKKIIELESRIRKAEMEGIRQNLSPHLFKNILNSIQSHAYLTYFALDRLAGVLDYILYEGNRPFVSLREELEFVKNYIEINKLKLSPLFDFRFKILVDEVNPYFNRELILPLITVHPIENAFKHADMNEPDSFISVMIELDHDIFRMTVSNKISALPLTKSRSGKGMDNFKKRMEIIYKNNYTFETHSDLHTYMADLKINLFEHENQMPASRR
jgi:LytS/YehU family sensor histidine kinase